MKKLISILLAVFFGCFLFAQNSSNKNEIQSGLAKNYPNDLNIGSDPSVIFASGFENGFEGWTRYNKKVSEIISNPDSAFSGNNVLKTTATRDLNTGGDVRYDLSEGQDQLYIRFYTKLDKNTITPHHFVKIQAIKEGFWPNAGQNPPGDKGFWTGIEPSANNTWHFYTYWHEMQSWQSGDGKPDGRPNPYYGNMFYVPDQTPFEKGEWVCVEAMVKANTPGQHNGEQAFWIDGKKIGEWKAGEPMVQWKGDRVRMDGENLKPFPGFNWRTTDDLKLNTIILRWYISAEHMKMKKATQDANSVFFDDVVIATKYIGPRYDRNGPVLDKNR